MESRFKVGGHAVHPMLIVVPLGLLPVSVAFDIVWYVTDDAQYAAIGFFMVAAGLIGAALAALAGTVDALAIPSGSRAKRIVLLHGSGNVVVALLFAVSWVLRRDTPVHQPTTASLTLAIIASMLGVAAAWLGGELIERLGVGVDEGAHIDAPNSLRHGKLAEIDVRDRPGSHAPSPAISRDRANADG